MDFKKTDPIIIANSLTRIYTVGDTAVVGINQVDLQIASGEMVVLKGDSGCGKSTLLALLAGLDRPTSGNLFVANQRLEDPTANELTRFRRKIVGMVFQTFNLLPTLSVLENACLPALLAGMPLAQSRAKAAELLDWMGLTARLDHLPAQLSGGEMQRTAIARALINDPAIVLADEPTGNLDSQNGQMVIRLLAELNQRWGRTVIIATHSTLADQYASLKVVLQDGMIIEQTCAE